VLALADLLGIDCFHLCGVSIGGIIALWLGIHASARVLSLIPSNTAARIGSEESWNARIEQVRAQGLVSIADGTMERWFTPGFREQEQERIQAIRAALIATDESAYVGCCVALRDTDLRGEISSISAPTLVIAGSHDPVTPPSEGLFLERHIPGSIYRELDASHISNVEASDGFLAALLAFLP
jgi:3-oxoadipate enol-lactonase